MSRPKKIDVKESSKELNLLLKTCKPLFVPRILMLLEIKKHSKEGVSKRALAEIIGVNHNSVQTWRSLYQQGGIDLLCSHNLRGFRPSVISPDEHKAIEEKLNDPENGLKGYVELMHWLEKEFGKKVIYNTLMKYCRRNFSSKIKVARKSHIKKNKNAVEEFKKTLPTKVKC